MFEWLWLDEDLRKLSELQKEVSTKNIKLNQENNYYKQELQNIRSLRNEIIKLDWTKKVQTENHEDLNEEEIILSNSNSNSNNSLSRSNDNSKN